MARNGPQGDDYIAPLRRLLTAVLVLVLVGVFVLWRIDSPRMERLRAEVTDRVVPSFEWAMAPVTATVNLARDFQSYRQVVQQNNQLRRELQQMKAWKEAALQLEQENARLLDLNKVRLDPRLTHVTGVVMADSGSPFRQSVLLNVGARDGIRDGWATMDGIGLVGRVSGVGKNTSRVILLTDSASRVPATVQPSGQPAILRGDNTMAPRLAFVETPEDARPGDRVVSSGDGGVFPAGLLIGQVAKSPAGRLRVRLAADFERLEFLRVLRSPALERITAPVSLVAPGNPARPARTPAATGAGHDRAIRSGAPVADARRLSRAGAGHLRVPAHAAGHDAAGVGRARPAAGADLRMGAAPARLRAGVVGGAGDADGRPAVPAPAGPVGGAGGDRHGDAQGARAGPARPDLRHGMGHVAVMIVATVLGYRLILSLAMVPQAPLGLTAIRALMTVLAYPLVVAVSALVFGVRKAAPGEIDATGQGA